MDVMNSGSDICSGGFTLRSLRESRDLLTLPYPAKIMDKEDKDGNEIYSDASAAFLGPNLWDKTLSDFKLEYIDIEELLGSTLPPEENRKAQEVDRTAKPEPMPQLLQLTSTQEGISVQNSLSSAQQQTQTLLKASLPPSPETSLSPPLEECEKSMTDVDCKFSPSDLALATLPGQDNFDPTKNVLPDDELKPQPMIKKSRKHFVPDDLKDDKYWARRRKNNIAAKRSREARRVKENQIVLRASFLEKENNLLKEDVLRLKAENDMLRNQLKTFSQ